MKTLYAACLSRLGLSQAEATALHGVRLDTVKSWSSGRNLVPQGAWDELRQREAEIVDGSKELRDHWGAAGSPPIELDDTGGGDRPLMTAADFVLGTEPGVPVRIGRTHATRTARRSFLGQGHTAPCGG